MIYHSQKYLLINELSELETSYYTKKLFYELLSEAPLFPFGKVTAKITLVNF